MRAFGRHSVSPALVCSSCVVKLKGALKRAPGNTQRGYKTDVSNHEVLRFAPIVHSGRPDMRQRPGTPAYLGRHSIKPEATIRKSKSNFFGRA